MVEVGGRPMLWQIMKIYSHYGFRDFVLCLGCKGDIFRNYFLQYDLLHCDFTVEVGKNRFVPHATNHDEQDWRVRLVLAGTTGVVNVVGKDRMPRSELAVALAKAMALDPNLIVPFPTADLGAQAPRPLEGGLNTDRLQSLLGTEPLDLTQSLKRLRRHWRAETHIAQGPAATTTEADDLKREFQDKVRRYYQVAHKPQQFVPFKTRINYAGRVYGEEKMVSLVDSALTSGSLWGRLPSSLSSACGATSARRSSSWSTPARQPTW